MRRIRIAVVAALIAIMTMASVTPALAKVGDVYICRVNGLRVHAKANGSSDVIGKLNKGDKVVHKATKNGGWWKIQTVDGDHIGFAYRSYFKPAGNIVKKNAYYRVYKISKATVRSGPRAISDKVATVKRGTQVQLLGKKNNWAYVKGSNGSKGWIQMKYLKYVNG
ncbi:MAG: SH3 domain-containing protein [Clostridia bacterium]|nr:SH3 domain-containing protein [Clostridia bacterium]